MLKIYLRIFKGDSKASRQRWIPNELEPGSLGRVGDLAYDPIHRCPVRGQIARCYTVDGFHNCNLCGSTWRTSLT